VLAVDKPTLNWKEAVVEGRRLTVPWNDPVPIDPLFFDQLGRLIERAMHESHEQKWGMVRGGRDGFSVEGVQDGAEAELAEHFNGLIDGAMENAESRRRRLAQQNQVIADARQEAEARDAELTRRFQNLDS
jgi:hypothetical protein